MATVGQLLTVLHRRVWELGTPTATPPNTTSAHLAAWFRLAQAAQRAMHNLPVPPGSDVASRTVTARAVLEPLANGSLIHEPPDRPDRSLSAVATLIGGLADLLAGSAADSSPHQEAAAGLQANLLASLHVAARWTHATLDDTSPADTRQAFRHLINASEPYALLHPAQRARDLDHVGLAGVAEPDLAGALRRWALIATDVLASPYRVTGYALQVVAGDLSVLSGAALRTVEQAHQVGLIGPHVAAQTSASLTGSARAWAQAAAWPAHISLGGRTPGLRQASNDLITACTDTPAPTSTQELADQMAGMRAALRSALPVAEQHTLTMHQLAWGHGLWIAAATIPHMYDTAEVNLAKARDGWTREPIWMQEGVPPLRASQQATRALLTASAFLDQTTQPALDPQVLARQLTLTHDRIQLTPTPDHRWETVTPPTSPPRASTRANDTHPAPGVGL